MSQTAQTPVDLIDLPLAEKVELFVDFVFGGRHHTSKVIIPDDHDGFFEVQFWQDVATWDGNIMTKMVVAGHDLGLRVNFDANGLRGMKVLLHNRKSREGKMHTRHPTLEQHLELIGRVTQ
jgi:hypothetical protein